VHDPAFGIRRLSLAEVSKHFTGIALELSPTSQFRPADERRRIRLGDLLGRVDGLRRSLAQVFVLASDEIGVGGFDLVVPADAHSDILEQLRRSGGISVGNAAVEICRIEGGRPLFGVDMSEETIPLEAGIENRAISLTKGCYVGQEVIIRVLHRGHGRVVRKLVGLALDPGAVVPAAGEKITGGDREIGSITSAVESPTLGRPMRTTTRRRGGAAAAAGSGESSESFSEAI